MYRGKSRYFKVMTNQARQFAVWHAEARPQGQWRETGCYGSAKECWRYVEQREAGRLPNLRLN